MIRLSEMVKEDKKIRTEEENSLSIKKIVDTVIKRQRVDKDSIVMVGGDRRNGKSTFGLQAIKEYIRQRKAIDPSFKWNWEDNFAKSTEEALSKYRKLPSGSFMFVDEGDDVASSGDSVMRLNRKLKKLMNKIGEKKIFTIINHPDILSLDKKIRNMAYLCVLIPYRYEEVCAFAFIYGRNQNPLNDDKFAMERTRNEYKKLSTSNKMFEVRMEGVLRIRSDDKYITIPYPMETFNILAKIPTYMGIIRFKKVDERTYAAYKKNVKDKILEAEEAQDVPRAEYMKVIRRYRLLLFNLFNHETSLAQLERLHIDPATGEKLIALQTIKRIIDKESIRIEHLGKDEDKNGNGIDIGQLQEDL